MSPRIRRTVRTTTAKHEVQPPHNVSYDLESLVNVIEYYSRAGSSDPFKRPSVQHLLTYVNFLATSSIFPKGVYVTGRYELIKRRYHASRYSIYNRYKHIFPRFFYRQVHLSEAVYTAMFNKDLRYLISYLREMFATVNFFKHRFLLYYFRAAFVKMSGRISIPGVRGLFIKFRGKLAKAGNSRRQRFLLTHGQVTTNYTNSYVVEKFQIRTFTGAIGCTVILCCN